MQFVRLSEELKDNEALLAKTFLPDEMSSLRQGHKMLSYFKEAEKRGTVGLDTTDKWNIPTWAQLASRHVKGNLAGDGLIKRLELLLEQLPKSRKSADKIVQTACFNPDVAADVLERPISNANVPAHNIDLRRLVAANNAARESDAVTPQASARTRQQTYRSCAPTNFLYEKAIFQGQSWLEC